MPESGQQVPMKAPIAVIMGSSLCDSLHGYPSSGHFHGPTHPGLELRQFIR